jgi:disulfide bond formation protein DsbB
MKRTLIALTLTLTTLVGCSGQAAPPPAPASPPTPVSAAPASEGEKLYSETCVACHGSDGKGVDGLGKPLVGSPMLKETDKALVAFINVGRAPGEKGNTTGMAMPPKGGNPALSDDNLAAIVTYIRTLK